VLGRLRRDGFIVERPHGSRLPRGVMIPGLSSYIRVERALNSLSDQHRLVANVEYWAPVVEVGKTQL
jgi:hypothetical protein